MVIAWRRCTNKSTIAGRDAHETGIGAVIGKLARARRDAERSLIARLGQTNSPSVANEPRLGSRSTRRSLLPDIKACCSLPTLRCGSLRSSTQACERNDRLASRGVASSCPKPCSSSPARKPPRTAAGTTATIQRMPRAVSAVDGVRDGARSNDELFGLVHTICDGMTGRAQRRIHVVCRGVQARIQHSRRRRRGRRRSRECPACRPRAGGSHAGGRRGSRRHRSGPARSGAFDSKRHPCGRRPKAFRGVAGDGARPRCGRRGAQRAGALRRQVARQPEPCYRGARRIRSRDPVRGVGMGAALQQRGARANEQPTDRCAPTRTRCRLSPKLRRRDHRHRLLELRHRPEPRRRPRAVAFRVWCGRAHRRPPLTDRSSRSARSIRMRVDGTLVSQEAVHERRASRDAWASTWLVAVRGAARRQIPTRLRCASSSWIKAAASLAEHLDKVFEPLVSTKQELSQNNAQRLSHDRQHVCMFVHRNLARPSADGRRRAELRTPRSPAEASELTLLFHV